MTEKFELMPSEPPKKDQITAMIEDITADNVNKDFSQSQGALQNIVTIGSKAVSELGLLAASSQDPNHYNALAQLIKTVSDASGNLLKIHKALEEVKNKDNKDNVKTQIVHNNLNFNGSTAELAEALKKKNL